MKSIPVQKTIFSVGEYSSGRVITPKLKVLDEYNSLPLAEKTLITQGKIIAVLKNASVNVPYYRDLFKKINFSFEKLDKDFSYFQEIPFLTKNVILESPARFLSEKANRSGLHERKTAGSTGASLSVFYDQDSLDWTSAINLFALGMTGRKIENLEIHLSSFLNLHLSTKDKWREKVKCFILNRKNIHTKNFDENELSDLYLKIKNANAFLLQGHPSTLYALALYIRDKQLSVTPLFQVFESTGETLDQEKTAIIEKWIGCKVFNRYGSAEFGVIAHSLDDINELKILTPSVHVENFIYGAGIPEVVVTGLLNPTMPFIRYRTGDIGEVVEKNNEPFLINLKGRIHDILEVGGKKIPTHFVKDVLERVGGVDEFQFIKKRNGELQLNVVLNRPSQKNEIFQNVHAIFQNDIKVDFIRMSELRHVGWRDKFKYLITE